MSVASLRADLASALTGLHRVAVAVSGGVDSMTLATFAHRLPNVGVEMFHAVSAAVPGSATDRVRWHAAEQGWRLHIVDAGEFTDQVYLANPVNRCFFCKTHLYQAIATRTDAALVSGTNTDDLGDYRPGLRAASEYSVRHPFVEAGLDKAAVRGLSRELGLTDVSELPAAPCLASRIETGIPIVARTLGLVDEIEQQIRKQLRPESVRCRVRSGRLVIELDEPTLTGIPDTERAELAEWATALWRTGGRPALPVEFAGYQRGSAFLHSSSGARA